MSAATKFLVEEIRNRDSIIRTLMEQQLPDRLNAWDEGFTAAVNETSQQLRDPSHPFTRTNPYSATNVMAVIS